MFRFLNISYIVQKLTKKKLVLYHPHRQIIPVINNIVNKKSFLFINVLPFWKMIPLKSKYKLKFRLMYIILSIFNPKYILNVSWISKWDSLYKVWTLKHSNSKFIVLQHGAAVGGIRTRYNSTKCDVLLTWGDYFTEQFSLFNQGKKVHIISFGNPVYNLYPRADFIYRHENKGKILLAPSAVDAHRLNDLYRFIHTLEQLKFEIILKEHNYQGRGQLLNFNYPPIEGIDKTKRSLYEILQQNDFDLIISDISTALLDIIYFKNKVIFFSPEGDLKEYTDNHYSKYLKNAFYHYEHFQTKEDLYNFIDIDAQETLLANIIHEGSNVLTDYIK